MSSLFLYPSSWVQLEKTAQICGLLPLHIPICSLPFFLFLFCYETGSYYIAQGGLKLMILLSQPLE
jgi:hypothetical protein